MLIVAEIGVNWRSRTHAYEMMRKAKEAGADACKFQVFRDEHIKGHPRFKELQFQELTINMLQDLKTEADKIGIEFFATPFFPEAVDMLEEIGVKRYKIRYADQDNIPLIQRIEKTNKEVFISVAALEGWDGWHALYCVPKYPPKIEEIHIPREFCDSHEYYDYWYGYSNHYPGMAPALLAVARGAEYVEIHVKDDYNCYIDAGPIDDAVSWDFTQFKQFIRLTREMEALR